MLELLSNTDFLIGCLVLLMLLALAIVGLVAIIDMIRDWRA